MLLTQKTWEPDRFWLAEELIAMCESLMIFQFQGNMHLSRKLQMVTTSSSTTNQSLGL